MLSIEIEIECLDNELEKGLPFKLNQLVILLAVQTSDVSYKVFVFFMYDLGFL